MQDEQIYTLEEAKKRWRIFIKNQAEILWNELREAQSEYSKVEYV